MSENDGQVIQTACSLSIKNRNNDGSISVHCKRCGRRICDVDGRNNFFSAVCVLCQAFDEGTTLPKEIEDQLKTVKMPGGREIPLSIIANSPPPDPMVGDKPVVGSVDYWFKAIVVKAAVAIKKKIKTDLGSKDLSKEKKRKPILTSGFEINLNPNATHKDDDDE